MKSYKIFFDRDVEKELAKIAKTDVRKIILKAMKLSENPRPRQSLKLENSNITHRLRVGDYRVIYQIDDNSKTVTIYHIRHRKDVYRSI